MGSLVTCGTIDKNIIYPIISALTVFSNQYSLKEAEIEENPIQFLFYSVSKCLSFIPFLIMKKRSKTKYKKNLTDKLVKQYKTTRYKRFRLILISSILDFSQACLSVMFPKDNNHWAFDILVINFVSLLFLKTKLYKHHYCCLIIIIISGVFLNIWDYCRKEIDFIKIIMNYIKELLLSLQQCLDKYIMDKTYTSPYELCLYNGLLNLCFSLAAFGVIELCYKEFIKKITKYFDQINYIQILFLFILSISYLLFALCNYNSVKIYSPNFIINIFIIHEIYHSTFDNNKIRVYFNIAIGIIFIFLFLIFNEIIEINCF